MAFWIVLIAIIGWCLLKARSNTSPKSETVKIKENQPLINDPYLENIEKFSNSISSEIESSANEHKNLLEAKYRQDLEKKEQLSTFAKKNYLDKALIAVWLEIKAYPSWCKREDFPKYNKLHVNDCVETKNEKENKIISFSWQGRKFEISCEERPSCVPDDDSYGYADFKLFEEEKESFGITTSININEMGDSHYNAFSITTFKKKGEWCNFLLESWKIIKIEEEKRKIEWNYINADKIKNNFQD